MNDLYEKLVVAALCVYGVLMIGCLIRALRGPHMADRVIAINMTGTIVIAMIVLLAAALNEPYLVDMALVYAMINFIATVLLCRSYVGVFRARRKRKEKKADD